jgi:fructokinase
MKQFDVTALGELLIDFTENGLSAQGNYLLEANPGGAPCNVLAMLSKLGKKTAFIGKVGDDFLGRHLKNVVQEVGIDTSNLLLDDQVHTTLAFVHTSPDGDRDFSFYRNPGADMNLCEAEVGKPLIADSRIFHFGSLSMTHPGVREATKKALRIAKEHGCLISFDPNLREPLWNTLDEAKEQIAFGLTQCDILKISDNEIQWFTGKQDFDEGIRQLQQTYHIPLILLSMGKSGSRAYYGNMKVEATPFLQRNTIETTGAGDTFCACVLNYVLDHGMKDLSEDDLHEMLSFANAAAALITTKKGALRVMPTKEEVDSVLVSAQTP